MITFFDSNTGGFGQLTVLGHILSVGDELIDLRLPESPYAIDGYKGSGTVERKAETEYDRLYSVALANLLLDWLPNADDWEDEGANEKDWEFAVYNQNSHIRAMAALAGQGALVLKDDEDVFVRVCLVQSLINNRLVGVRHDDSFLDLMLNDEEDNVICKIAEYGKIEHLNILANSKSLDVLSEVVRHKIPSHLRQMANHKDDKVRLLAAKFCEDKDILSEIKTKTLDGGDIAQAIKNQISHIDKQTRLKKLKEWGYEGLSTAEQSMSAKALGYDLSINLDSFLDSLSYSEKFSLIDAGCSLAFFGRNNQKGDLVFERAQKTIALQQIALKSRTCVISNRHILGTTANFLS